MKQRLSAVEKARLAELVAARTPFWKICEEIDRDRKTTWRNIGYLRRLPPAPTRRSPLRLSLAEREEISRGSGWWGVVAVDRAVVSAGLRRRCLGRWRPMAASAGIGPVSRIGERSRAMRRPKPAKLAQCPRLRAVVEAKLELRWSPQQISGWLALAFPDDPEMRVSHETIYLSLYVQARGALRRELARNLRTGRMTRRPAGYVPTVGKGQLTHTVHISERPAEADDRAVPGHWEGDLIFGKGMSAVATLVERSSRFVLLVGLPNGHTADVVAAALADKMTALPVDLRRSLTWDHGSEMARHADFTVASGMPVYFCDPRSPWQRGTNENTNGLLRQYFPKRGFDLRTLTQTELDDVADELNGRPRQTLGWRSPSQALDHAIR